MDNSEITAYLDVCSKIYDFSEDHDAILLLGFEANGRISLGVGLGFTMQLLPPPSTGEAVETSPP